VIFYTIQGPGHELEIHDDKLKLTKKTWLRQLSKKESVKVWELKSLSGFEISVPHFLFWGKIEWRSYDGSKGSFRFSTNPEMVKKIEKYMQKMILKNIQRKNHLAYVPAGQEEQVAA
jgi:hypothetical protein